MNFPPVKGDVTEWRDGRYRIWTVQHVPFDQFPAYGEGGPAMVALGDWGVSTQSLCRLFSSQSVIDADDGKHELHVYRFPKEPGPMERHELYGTKYDTSRDADRAAYEAGVLGYMVYLCDEAEFGLREQDVA